MNAICIACGCDEHHACVDISETTVGGPNCWWLRFDAAAGVGLCSACADLAREWDAAPKHGALTALIAERYYRQVMPLYQDKADALAWITSPQILLGNHSPRELILAGELDKVRTLVDQLVTGAYI